WTGTHPFPLRSSLVSLPSSPRLRTARPGWIPRDACSKPGASATRKVLEREPVIRVRHSRAVLIFLFGLLHLNWMAEHTSLQYNKNMSSDADALKEKARAEYDARWEAVETLKAQQLAAMTDEQARQITQRLTAPE